MNNKILIIIFKVFFFTLIPAVFFYLSQSNSYLDTLQKAGYIGPTVDIINLKDTFLILGIFLSTILLSFNYAVSEISWKKATHQRDSLLKYNKDIFISYLENKLDIKNINLNIRIYVPNKSIILKIKNIINYMLNRPIIREFSVKNIGSLADIGNMYKLSFQVEPQAQGIVGQCYQLKKIICDDNLQLINKSQYNLTEYHINKLCDLKLIICAPIFDEKNNVIAVISFDSKESINMSGNEHIWKHLVINYCEFLHEYLSELFK